VPRFSFLPVHRVPGLVERDRRCPNTTVPTAREQAWRATQTAEVAMIPGTMRNSPQVCRPGRPASAQPTPRFRAPRNGAVGSGAASPTAVGIVVREGALGGIFPIRRWVFTPIQAAHNGATMQSARGTVCGSGSARPASGSFCCGTAHARRSRAAAIGGRNQSHAQARTHPHHRRPHPAAGRAEGAADPRWEFEVVGEFDNGRDAIRAVGALAPISSSWTCRCRASTASRPSRRSGSAIPRQGSSC